LARRFNMSLGGVRWAAKKKEKIAKESSKAMIE
jgi:hypothetical protein